MTDRGQADGSGARPAPGGHTHGVSAGSDHRYLMVALGLIVGFMVVEVIVAVLASSLALIADAGHMLADVGAIVGSIWALRLAQRPASNRWSFGLKRAEILAAAVNGVTLLVVAVLVLLEAIRRLIDPAAAKGLPIVVVAVVGVMVNIAAAWVLAKANRSSLNVEGAYQHIVTDLYGFIATAVAAVVIMATGFDRADPIASLIIAGLLLHAAYGLLRESGRVFMEAAPTGLAPDEIGRTLAGQPGVVEVHDLHVWEVTSGFPALSAHVVVRAGDDCHERRRLLQRMVGERCGISHTTLQVDHEAAPQPPLQIEVAPHAEHAAESYTRPQ
jgi:cobalt-zinc-cadmium efflux system protein